MQELPESDENTSPREVIMIPASPKTIFARDLIGTLQQVPELGPYVLDQPYSAADQTSTLLTRASQYGGCLAVVPQLVINDKQDASVRDAYLQGEWGIVGIVHTVAWQSAQDLDPAIETAADFMDALLGLTIAAVVSWRPHHSPYGCPMIVGEEAVQLAGTGWEQTDVRGIRVRCPLLFPEIIFSTTEENNE